jgi:Ca2+-binding RTX toxin-like protein
MRVGPLLFVLAALGLAAAPAAYAAGTAAINGSELTVTGAAGVEFSKIKIKPSSTGTDWRVLDEKDSMAAGAGCTQVGEEASCPRAGTTSLAVDAGDLKDHVRADVDIPATITLGTGPDQARGGTQPDEILGGPGEDNLEGRESPDVLDGGDDKDTVLYILRPAAEPVTVTLDGLANDGGTDDSFSDHVLGNVENVNATPGPDTIVGNDERNNLAGGAGDDEITAGGGDDMLFGQGDDDTLSGEAGVDGLDGGDGADDQDGGTEKDTALYKSRTASQPVDVSLDGVANDGGALDGSADNVHADVEDVAAGSGDDTLTGSSIRNSLKGGAGADELNGDSDKDNLNGDAGGDTLNGGGADDTLLGGDGADQLFGDSDRDTLDGGTGPDTVDGGTGRDVATYTSRTAAQPVTVTVDGVADDGGALDSNDDNLLDSVENVKGGAGDDSITGNGSDNVLTGNAGEDQLHGEAGNDELRANGDGSADNITCGAGSSDVVFRDLGVDTFAADCEVVR